MRDLQETQPPFFAACDRIRDCLRVFTVALSAVRLRENRGLEVLAAGFAQATDLAERAVVRGVPFREAYQAVGALVRNRLDQGKGLAGLTIAEAQAHLPSLTAEDLGVLDPRTAVEAKRSAGGTGSASVSAQVTALRADASRANQTAERVPRTTALAEALRQTEI
jgi:argininosuccinate lyase